MLRQFSIGTRAIGAFGLIGVFVIILGLFALNRMGAIADRMHVITDKQVPAVEKVNALNNEFLYVNIYSANVYTYLNDPDRLQRYLDRLDSASASLKEAQEEYSSLIEDPEARKLFNEYKALDKKYWQLNKQFLELVNAKLPDVIASLRENSLIPLSTEISAKLNQLQQREMALISDAGDNATSVYESANIAVIIAIIAVVSLLIFFAIMMTKSVVSPISAAVDFAKVIASRDLTQTIDVVGNDEPAQLLRQLIKTRDELRESISTISESSEQLASTSEELSSVTQDSTRTIQQQTEELEQAATAVNELTTAVETVAQDAQNASEASEEANRQAQQGDDRVRQTVRAIEELSQEIGDSSSNVTELAEKVTSITKVLEVIRGIAEQTNLLALNAAIEAARAGESGRGFAVVADEVRSLAHKTQQSTVEIEDMVKAINESSDRSVSTMEKSMERATRTLDVAREAGEALQLIATAVSEINNHNTSIASAAEEQANVARDVDKNLVSIRDLSNSTASGAEQTNASSDELSRLAVDLSELVKRFRV
ncbi:methyl-accepting chemotaxis protein [Idiomarina sp. X4]|uniref:methyl-accepting chemotaxis protein n=1 Tax=Idiomarina sp. X4 TaxID=2055892 RepID=UPI000C286FF5|nr:methyl-accepting chemotaxis protein [Idiomarina sp. X4]ATZ72657.1 methyl-accepting chemotaxis protein [Idiomarina sp. X4]